MRENPGIYAVPPFIRRGEYCEQKLVRSLHIDAFHLLKLSVVALL
ncbi:hypothetical protein LF1_14660 [Rubripirellula obstinata]|uniref:Uncharacterized protein n=1 Tax=Rubripirellula obstinata TaxID=406547 RepID=A0A5B1CFG8_9BACT|nr:hypothetical protein LF1_14660 [Rubripirellula obstinata]